MQALLQVNRFKVCDSRGQMLFIFRSYITMLLGSQIIGYDTDGRMNGDEELEKIWKEDAVSSLNYC